MDFKYDHRDIVTIDGITDDEGIYIPNVKSYTVRNPAIIENLSSYSLRELSNHFAFLSFERNFKNSLVLLLDLDIFLDGSSSFISLRINPDLTFWNKPYSFIEFCEAFNSKMQALDVKFMVNEDWEELIPDEGFCFDYRLTNLNEKLIIELQSLHQLLPSLFKQCDNDLTAESNSDSYIAYFDFPEEIKISCKQYLLYFAQFLMDMGIEAETEIVEQTRDTLFKVIPKNKEESLATIKEALSVFLNAPGTKNFEMITEQSNDIAMMQWKSNVFHLKSQIALASAVIQAKDETIEALKLANYQLVNNDKEKSEKQEEELIPGVVAVTKYESKGFSINLPEIVRNLKRRFK